METRNRVHEEEEIVPGVTIGQLKSLHKAMGNYRLEGEFTRREYAEALGIADREARKELNKAVEQGKVEVRLAGRLNYYKFK